jgi:hypothetical protein
MPVYKLKDIEIGSGKWENYMYTPPDMLGVKCAPLFILDRISIYIATRDINIDGFYGDKKVYWNNVNDDFGGDIKSISPIREGFDYKKGVFNYDDLEIVAYNTTFFWSSFVFTESVKNIEIRIVGSSKNQNNEWIYEPIFAGVILLDDYEVTLQEGMRDEDAKYYIYKFRAFSMPKLLEQKSIDDLRVALEKRFPVGNNVNSYATEIHSRRVAYRNLGQGVMNFVYPLKQQYEHDENDKWEFISLNSIIETIFTLLGIEFSNNGFAIESELYFRQKGYNIGINGVQDDISSWIGVERLLIPFRRLLDGNEPPRGFYYQKLFDNNSNKITILGRGADSEICGLNFGSVSREAGKDAYFNIKNTGYANITINSIRIENEDSEIIPIFTITNYLPATIQVGETRQFILRLKPIVNTAGGTLTAVMKINYGQNEETSIDIKAYITTNNETSAVSEDKAGDATRELTAWSFYNFSNCCELLCNLAHSFGMVWYIKYSIPNQLMPYVFHVDISCIPRRQSTNDLACIAIKNLSRASFKVSNTESINGFKVTTPEVGDYMTGTKEDVKLNLLFMLWNPNWIASGYGTISQEDFSYSVRGSNWEHCLYYKAYDNNIRFVDSVRLYHKDSYTEYSYHHLNTFNFCLMRAIADYYTDADYGVWSDTVLSYELTFLATKAYNANAETFNIIANSESYQNLKPSHVIQLDNQQKDKVVITKIERDIIKNITKVEATKYES